VQLKIRRLTLLNNLIIHEEIFMERRISYRANPDKTIEAIVWIANKKPAIDIYHVAKVLYYAEKEHINKYARPIIGDTYISMGLGQVPSQARDLITQNPWMPKGILSKFSNAVKVSDHKDKYLTAQRTPNLDLFSQTDIECLSRSLKKYGNIPFKELKKMSHKEKTWLNTELDQPIDYALMIDDDNPNKEEILEELQSSIYARF